MYSIDSVTPTICKNMNINTPKGSSAKPIKEIAEMVEKESIRKVLLYAPDAIGEWLF